MWWPICLSSPRPLAANKALPWFTRTLAGSGKLDHNQVQSGRTAALFLSASHFSLPANGCNFEQLKKQLTVSVSMLKFLLTSLLCLVYASSMAQAPGDGQFGCPDRTQFFSRPSLEFVRISRAAIE